MHVMLNHLQRKVILGQSLPGPIVYHFASMTEVRFKGLSWPKKMNNWDKNLQVIWYWEMGIATNNCTSCSLTGHYCIKSSCRLFWNRFPLTTFSNPLRYFKAFCFDYVHWFRLRSNGIGNEVQPERLGLFKYQGQLKHGRKIYVRSENGQQNQYLYFWDWGPNNGAQWMVGLDSSRKPHGIESASMEKVLFDTICPLTAQLTGPFSVRN